LRAPLQQRAAGLVAAQDSVVSFSAVTRRSTARAVKTDGTAAGTRW
jgi:hypothetical protein